jgi:hypothetical protein
MRIQKIKMFLLLKSRQHAHLHRPIWGLGRKGIEWRNFFNTHSCGSRCVRAGDGSFCIGETTDLGNVVFGLFSVFVAFMFVVLTVIFLLPLLLAADKVISPMTRVADGRYRKVARKNFAAALCMSMSV